jgi:hypothetical protein
MDTKKTENIQTDGVKIKPVATVNLTEQQVQSALVALVSDNNDLKSVLKDKKGMAWVNWHVNKWDKQDVFCTLSFGIVDDENQLQAEHDPVAAENDGE